MLWNSHNWLLKKKKRIFSIKIVWRIPTEQMKYSKKNLLWLIPFSYFTISASLYLLIVYSPWHFIRFSFVYCRRFASLSIKVSFIAKSEFMARKFSWMDCGAERKKSCGDLTTFWKFMKLSYPFVFIEAND